MQLHGLVLSQWVRRRHRWAHPGRIEQPAGVEPALVLQCLLDPELEREVVSVAFAIDAPAVRYFKSIEYDSRAV